jgi:hypothetical protein
MLKKKILKPNEIRFGQLNSFPEFQPSKIYVHLLA